MNPGLGARFTGLDRGEERRDLPKRRQAYQAIGDSGQGGPVAEQGGDEIELESAAEAPVQAPDNDEKEGEEVQGFHGFLRC